MTLPLKPWHVKYEGSANSLRDAAGGILCFIPNKDVAEHIIDCCNGQVAALEQLEATLNEQHDAEILKKDERIEQLEKELRKYV